MSTQHKHFNPHGVAAALSFDEQREELTAQLAQLAGDDMPRAMAHVERLALRSRYFNRLSALAETIRMYRDRNQLAEGLTFDELLGDRRTA